MVQPDFELLNDFIFELKTNEKESEKSGPDKIKFPAPPGIVSATMVFSLFIYV